MLLNFAKQFQAHGLVKNTTVGHYKYLLFAMYVFSRHAIVRETDLRLRILRQILEGNRGNLYS